MNIEIDNIAISLLGTALDNRGQGQKRWARWRPTRLLCQHDDLRITRLELLFQLEFQKLADQLAVVSPETRVIPHLIDFEDP